MYSTNKETKIACDLSVSQLHQYIIVGVSAFLYREETGEQTCTSILVIFFLKSTFASSSNRRFKQKTSLNANFKSRCFNLNTAIVNQFKAVLQLLLVSIQQPVQFYKTCVVCFFLSDIIFKIVIIKMFGISTKFPNHK